ncbi:MAG TPA: hypothetical protein VEQ59_01955 [Polyangiaceae bacterium]|nr:hypothetical protein [Polyangiaceae bacterium]
MSNMVSQPTSAASAASPAWGTESCPVGVTPEERLLALVVFSQLQQMDTAKDSVNASFEELARLKQEVKEAMDKAKEAQKHSGFLGALSSILGGDIGAIASAVAAVAAVVATGGAATAVLALVATATSIAGQHAKELGIPPGVAMAIGIVAAGAMLCCGNGAGLFQVSDSVKKVAVDVRFYASIASGLANAGGAATSIAAGAYKHTADAAQADAREAEGQRELCNVDLDQAIKLVSDAIDNQDSAVRTVSEGKANEKASFDLVLSGAGGVA